MKKKQLLYLLFLPTLVLNSSICSCSTNGVSFIESCNIRVPESFAQHTVYIQFKFDQDIISLFSGNYKYIDQLGNLYERSIESIELEHNIVSFGIDYFRFPSKGTTGQMCLETFSGEYYRFNFKVECEGEDNWDTFQITKAKISVSK